MGNAKKYDIVSAVFECKYVKGTVLSVDRYPDNTYYDMELCDGTLLKGIPEQDIRKSKGNNSNQINRNEYVTE